MKKVCTRHGGKPLPLSCFPKHPRHADGHNSLCKPCHAQAQREWRTQNLEQERERSNRYDAMYRPDRSEEMKLRYQKSKKT